jgi:hypothetical protein
MLALLWVPLPPLKPLLLLLQVKNAAGQWITAAPLPGSFVCNIGDMAQVGRPYSAAGQTNKRGQWNTSPAQLLLSYVVCT